MLLRNQHAFQFHDEIESSCTAIHVFTRPMADSCRAREQHLLGNDEQLHVAIGRRWCLDTCFSSQSPIRLNAFSLVETLLQSSAKSSDFRICTASPGGPLNHHTQHHRRDGDRNMVGALVLVSAFVHVN